MEFQVDGSPRRGGGCGGKKVHQMKKYFFAVFFCLSSFYGHSQISFNSFISANDSLQVLRFWEIFSKSIEKRDRIKLEKVFQFPFDCPQCKDYLQDNGTYRETITVSRKLFRDSVCQMFFDIPFLTRNNQLAWERGITFYPSNYKSNRTALMFSYQIMAPSATYEGMQGYIYISKRKGRYLISRLTVVP